MFPWRTNSTEQRAHIFLDNDSDKEQTVQSLALFHKYVDAGTTHCQNCDKAIFSLFVFFYFTKYESW